MPRASNPKSPRTSKPASLSRPASRRKTSASLDDQLSKVMEREGVAISSARAPSAPTRVRPSATKRSKSKPAEDVLPIAALPQPPVPDPIRAWDKRLPSSNASGKGPHSRRVPIRRGDHAPSAHLLEFQGTVSEVVEAAREAVEETIRHWVAPYEIPPSLEAIVAEAHDLQVDYLDPRCLVEQFTPANPAVAYGERYGWWSRLYSPFIRWEIQAAPLVAPAVSNDESDWIADQLTPANADEAFRSVYAEGADWLGKLKQDTETFLREVRGREVERAAPAEEAWPVPAVVPKLDFGRVMIGFFCLLLLAAVPAGAVTLSRSLGQSVGQIAAQGAAALSEARAASAAQPSAQAAAWSRTSQRFLTAQNSLLGANAVAVALAQALPATREAYQSTQALIEAGGEASQAAQTLSEGLGQALHAPARFPEDRLLTLETYLGSAEPALAAAHDALGRVHPDRLPVNVRGQVSALSDLLTQGQTSLRGLDGMLQFLVAAIGHDRPRNYLFIFQNQTELRPTGGFMGSLAQVTLDRGAVTDVFVPGGGPYDLKNQLMVRVAPPLPLSLVDGRWEFQDANWFPDFPAAASKIRWFWSKAGQPTVDGVIAVNASFMQKLLTVTGPIDLPAYGKTITADNFLLETQKAVELDYNKTENKPKKIIGDLLQQVMERFKNGDSALWLKAAGLLSDALQTKDIQVAMSNPDEEAQVEGYGWNGRLKAMPGDALAVIEANVAGQKTDGVIRETAAHDAEVQPDGSIIDTLTLTRRHAGQKGDLFSGTNNVEYLRVYVPEGSTLLSASGFDPPDPKLFKQPLPTDPPDADVSALVTPVATGPGGVQITDEFGRTAFGGWLQLEPGQTVTTEFRYRLPFTVFDLARDFGQGAQNSASHAAYLLLLTSQSGKTDREITSQLHVPAGWQALWTNGATSTGTGLVLDAPWDRDRIVAGYFELPHDQKAP